MEHPRMPVLAWLGGLLLLFSGCVSNAEVAPVEPEDMREVPQIRLLTVTESDVEVAVLLAEWLVHPKPRTVPAGNVSFEIENQGLLPHQFSVFWTDIEADEIPVVQGKADAAVARAFAATDELQPGDDDELTLVLPPGAYVLLCNLPAHYEAGMRVAFTAE